MRITEVEPILLRGTETYGSTASGAEATDNGDCSGAPLGTPRRRSGR